jgi:hypothetical protein
MSVFVYLFLFPQDYGMLSILRALQLVVCGQMSCYEDSLMSKKTKKKRKKWVIGCTGA